MAKQHLGSRKRGRLRPSLKLQASAEGTRAEGGLPHSEAIPFWCLVPRLRFDEVRGGTGPIRASRCRQGSVRSRHSSPTSHPISLALFRPWPPCCCYISPTGGPLPPSSHPPPHPLVSACSSLVLPPPTTPSPLQVGPLPAPVLGWALAGYFSRE